MKTQYIKISTQLLLLFFCHAPWLLSSLTGDRTWSGQWKHQFQVTGLTGNPLNPILTWTLAQLVKNLPAMWETWVQSLGWDDPLEMRKATHSSIRAWRMPRAIQSMGSQRVRHDWAAFTSLSLLKNYGLIHWRLASFVLIYSSQQIVKKTWYKKRQKYPRDIFLHF